MQQTLADVRSGRSPDGTTLYLKRKNGLDPYVVEVAAVREGGIELGAPLIGTLVCLIDPERREVISTRGLEQVYELTGAEAAVCALIGDGYSNRA